MVSNPLLFQFIDVGGVGTLEMRVWAGSGGRRRGVRPVAAAVLLLVLASAAGAEEPPPTTFMGIEVAPASGAYLVVKDVNIRAAPKTAGKRLGGLKRGAHVEAVGSAARGGWLAVRQGDDDLGFVYAPVLVPLIDGALDSDLKGMAQGPDGTRCAYVVRFTGKSQVPGQLFDTADYDVAWTCEGDGRKVAFSAYMFITEAPYNMSRRPVYQISVDVLDIAGGYEEILSTVLLYRRDKAQVVLDSVTMDPYAASDPIGKRSAGTVRDALVAAVEMTASSWNAKVLEDLDRAADERGGPARPGGD